MSRGKLTLPSGAQVDAPAGMDHVPASAPLKSTGDDVALSLDLLKLVYRHDKDPATLVERARELKRLLLAPES